MRPWARRLPGSAGMETPLRPAQLHGVLVIDKPKGPTSAKVLAQVKHGLGQKKIGHAGTLDPMATGVLVALLGEATKIAGFVTEARKEYSGCLRLGMTTDTFDAEGRVTGEAPWEHLAPEDILAEVSSWKDMTTQEIPPYSAVKVNGQPLYKMARAGREAPVIVKPVTVFDAEVRSMELPHVNFRVRVSSGGYVRSLVHSLGTRLGCGAHLTKLTRECSHPFGLAQAACLDELLAHPLRLAERVIPIADALPDWPKLALTRTQARLVRDGKRLALEELPGPRTRALLVAPDGRPAALVQPRQMDGAWRWDILRGFAAEALS